MAVNTKDPRLQKGILLGLVVCGIFYLYFFTDLAPFTYKASAQEMSELETRYRDLSKDLNKARQAVHRLPYLEREYQLLHRKWEQSQALLPDHQDMAWVLRTISLLGAQNGVEFTLFRPLPSQPAQYHTENPVEIKVVGGYHQVGAFLGEVANLDRIVSVRNLEVKTSTEKDPEKPAEASFLAVTYTLGGTGVPLDAAATGNERGAAGSPRPGANAAPGTRGGGHE